MKQTENRPCWNEYFIEFAKLAAKRATCLRRKVGAVIVKDNRILATGYNGAPKKLKHCIEVGCLRDKMNVPSGEKHEICRGVHAEQNAIIQAAYYGISLKNSVLYCTNTPCAICAKMLINAGIKKVYYIDTYNDKISINLFKEANIELIKLN